MGAEFKVPLQFPMTAQRGVYQGNPFTSRVLISVLLQNPIPVPGHRSLTPHSNCIVFGKCVCSNPKASLTVSCTLTENPNFHNREHPKQLGGNNNPQSFQRQVSVESCSLYIICNSSPTSQRAMPVLPDLSYSLSR